MAKPIEFKVYVPDAKDELQRRLQAAPVENAEAILASYDLLQKMHETGLLNILRSAVGAHPTILTHLVQLLSAPDSIRGIRNAVALGRVLGRVNPDLIHHLETSIPETAVQSPPETPPSMFAILRRLFGADSRRALAAATSTLEAVGRGMRPDSKN